MDINEFDDQVDIRSYKELGVVITDLKQMLEKLQDEYKKAYYEAEKMRCAKMILRCSQDLRRAVRQRRIIAKEYIKRQHDNKGLQEEINEKGSKASKAPEAR